MKPHETAPETCASCPSCGQELAPLAPGAFVEYGGSEGGSQVVGVVVAESVNQCLNTLISRPDGYVRFIALTGSQAGSSYTVKRRFLRQRHGYLHLDR